MKTISPLHELLDANLLLLPESQEKFANHLPMTLQALHSLGASEQRMRAFYAARASHFEEAMRAGSMPKFHSPDQDWRQLRGQEDALPALLTHFNRLVASRGSTGALLACLPDLMPGVAAAGLHGVIRTAHALQAGHAGELAAALAYWAWRWQRLTPPPAVEPLSGFDSWSERLMEHALGWRSDGELISIQMREASQSNTYLTLAGALLPAVTLEARLAELANFAVARYVIRPNFTVLHMITGLRALRILLPWLHDSAALQNTVVHCITAAYLAAQVPTPVPVPLPHAKPWADVIAAAQASNDDHVIKLVHACRDEAARYGEGQYLIAATLATIS